MKTRNFLFASAIALAAATPSALAATGTGTASAKVVQAVTLTKTSDLNFGVFIPGASAGTIVMNSSGVLTPTGVTLLPSATPTPVAGAFNMVGSGGSNYSVSVTSPTMSNGSGGTMTTALAVTPTSGTFSGAATAAATVAVKVSGQLNVGANQAAGAYTGTFTVTADYS